MDNGKVIKIKSKYPKFQVKPELTIHMSYINSQGEVKQYKWIVPNEELKYGIQYYDYVGARCGHIVERLVKEEEVQE